MEEEICITGGTGMIGTAMRKVLETEGYGLSVLSRSSGKLDNARVYSWDPASGEIDSGALEKADYVVHLAGANVGSKKWTESRKKEIRDSRIKTTRLLNEKLSKLKKRPSAFISSSSVGIYGHNTGSILIREDRVKPGDDFLATVTREWEEEILKIASLGIRVVIFRPHIVLSTKGGALPKFIMPARFGLAAPLGSGEQYISWIHIEDLCRLFLFAIRNGNLSGIYNAVSPNPETNANFNKKLASVLNKPFFIPNVPGFALRLVFGELASSVLGGNRVSSEKIENAGFEFLYPDLPKALEDLISNRK